MYFIFSFFKISAESEENMVKNRTPLIFAAVFFILFYSNNLAYAIEEIAQNNVYPDLAYEFTGKDKCEGFNRKLFVFNLKLNKLILRPVNILWASVMPKYGMERFKNMYNNINFPVRVVSCVLQKDFKSSKQETLRFLINTTIGVGGLYDPAKNKFKITPVQEDMSQVLAHCNCKQGPYLVLPVVRGNIRDLVGKLLNCPLRPLSYVPIAGSIANAVFAINNSTYVQPVIKMVDETYADPYEIAREYDGVSQYIKNENLDREDVFNNKTAAQNIIKIRNDSLATNLGLNPEIKLNGYNPQSPYIDSLRTALFKDSSLDNSKWSKLSVWNRNFEKELKLASVNVFAKRPNYKYKYILQNKKVSPIAILYPSFGEGINSEHSVILAKMLYERGYSVVIQGCAFQWEFVKSMPNAYCPGFPEQDAKYLRLVTSKIINGLQDKKKCQFDKRIVIGTSYGALTALFAAAQEENDNTLNISKYITLSPPIELFYAMKQMDKSTQEWKNDTSDLKMRLALTTEKTSNIYQKVSESKNIKEAEYLPFTEEEAKLIVGFIMRQKLSDVMFTAENNSRSKKSDFYKKVNNISFYQYGENYVFTRLNKAPEQIDYESSLHSISKFLNTNNNYKIYHSLDDYFINTEQLAWLKNQTDNRTCLISNGSHLGYLYRQEFLDEFKKDIELENKIPQTQEVSAPIDTTVAKGGL